jgi:multidrug resistance efflux pump
MSRRWKSRIRCDQDLLNLCRTEILAPTDGTVSQIDRQGRAPAGTGVPVPALLCGGIASCEAN